MLNLDQIQLSSFSQGKYTFYLKVKGSITVPIRGVDDKCRITATFTFSASCSFLPIQLIYNAKIKRCLPKCDFPNCFMLNLLQIIGPTLKSVTLFNKIIFLYLKVKKENLATQKNNAL